MAYLEWSASLELGHPIIDEDHAGMVRCINDLAGLYAPGQAGADRDAWKARVAEAVAALRQTTEKHFASEQWIMEMSGYPLLASHSTQHRELLAEYDAFADRFYDPENTEPVLGFLRDWFLYHVRTWDHSFTRWLENRADREPPGEKPENSPATRV